MKLPAYMNNGRWLLNCMRCGTALPAWDTGVVCPRCHPRINAKALRQLPNGLLRPVADLELVEEAKVQARALGEEYFPAYPDDKQEIERILRLRPNRANMNWFPNETIADLRQQNLEHGDPLPEE